MRYEVCDTDRYITWPYQIADHNCRITWVYNKIHHTLLGFPAGALKPLALQTRASRAPAMKTS